MNRSLRILALLGLTALGVVITGCNTVSVQSKGYLGVPTYAPTNPASVQILQQAPTVGYERLGEISVEPQGNPTTQEISAKIQAAGAAMGANAVVIVVDRTMLLGATVVGGPFWGGASVVPDTGRVIIGVAIRFTP